MVTSRAGETETFLVQLELQKCVYARDALTKAIYSSLFDWAVRFLNSKLDADKGGPAAPFIGILDTLQPLALLLPPTSYHLVLSLTPPTLPAA